MLSKSLIEDMIAIQFRCEKRNRCKSLRFSEQQFLKCRTFTPTADNDSLETKSRWWNKVTAYEQKHGIHGDHEFMIFFQTCS